MSHYDYRHIDMREESEARNVNFKLRLILDIEIMLNSRRIKVKNLSLARSSSKLNFIDLTLKLVQI